MTYLELRRLNCPMLGGLLIASIICTALAQGYDGYRLAQMITLALPCCLWLCWPHRSRPMQALQIGLCMAMATLFVLDSVIRAYLLDTYGATPNSSMVITAMANTGPAEASEFIRAYWRDLVQWKVGLLLSIALLVGACLVWWRHAHPLHLRPLWLRAALATLILVSLAAYLSKPIRRHHPLLLWPSIAESVIDLRLSWSRLQGERDSLRDKAMSLQPILNLQAPDLMVLVISESINRNHMSLYGYPRSTTPRLVEMQGLMGSALQVFRHAWSVDASTVPALRNLFYFGQPDAPDRNHLLAVASAAGYKTWWIGNQDDLAIDQEHARLADHVLMLNQQPGRSGAQLDSAILPPLDEALRDVHNRKLIVIHLLGAHPHYRLRYPDSSGVFDNAEDQVTTRVHHPDLSPWGRSLLNQYDSAIHFQDTVVAETLARTARHTSNVTWMYLSDHGQSVGESGHFGHTARSADGFRVPLLLWSSTRDFSHLDMRMPVRMDWLGFSVTNALGIEWQGYKSTQDVLAPAYGWQVPKLPISVDYCS